MPSWERRRARNWGGRGDIAVIDQEGYCNIVGRIGGGLMMSILRGAPDWPEAAQFDQTERLVLHESCRSTKVRAFGR